MPKLPREIQRGIEFQTEKKIVGEEGISHKITLDEQKYWAKRWHSRHYHEVYKQGPVYAEHSDWKTSVSPFWHKVILYETKLAHDALPDLILRIEASHDPRLHASGIDVDYKAGRPVTLTRDVVSDPSLRAVRDELVETVYADASKMRVHDEQGVYVGLQIPLKTFFFGKNLILRSKNFLVSIWGYVNLSLI